MRFDRRAAIVSSTRTMKTVAPEIVDEMKRAERTKVAIIPQIGSHTGALSDQEAKVTLVQMRDKERHLEATGEPHLRLVIRKSNSPSLKGSICCNLPKKLITFPVQANRLQVVCHRVRNLPEFRSINLCSLRRRIPHLKRCTKYPNCPGSSEHAFCVWTRPCEIGWFTLHLAVSTSQLKEVSPSEPIVTHSSHSRAGWWS